MEVKITVEEKRNLYASLHITLFACCCVYLCNKGMHKVTICAIGRDYSEPEKSGTAFWPHVWLVTQ